LSELDVLRGRIEACRLCPRLVRYRELVARTKRTSYRDEVYHGRPVAGFGDPEARIVIVGLAPGAHGANRTGRAFTGDKSGDFLFSALHRAGMASQPTSTHKTDGLRLSDVFISLAVRCAPPDNKPSRIEIKRCTRWFDAEVALLERARVYLALGSIAFRAVLGLEGRREHATKLPRVPKFGHGAEVTFKTPPHRSMLASYHVSAQNTLTGLLTPAMFDVILARAKVLAGR
jgi:uracil-DNA glycosylase family 4